MTSTFTSNINLEEPARGDDVGTWDTPVNANMSVIDLVSGGIATQSLNNSNVILSAAQFKCKQLTFNSTLTGTCFITFPTSFTKSYEIQNSCTGSSAFTVVLQTASTAAGIQGIGIPAGGTVTVFNDGANIKFTNLPPVGTYMDFANSSNPLWNTTCTVPPWLTCDGSTFSPVTYPTLAATLGGTTLPDLRGRSRSYLNGGTGRITSAVSGIDGNTTLAAGGSQSVTLVLGNLPPITPTGTITNGAITINGSPLFPSGLVQVGGGGSFFSYSQQSLTASQAASVFVGNSFGASAPFSLMPPTQISGITMIRAG